MRLIIDNQPVEGRDGDTVLTALARAGTFPPGCLCMGGDCPNCLATIDGVSHVRMCQTRVRPGMVVKPFPVDQHPSMPARGSRPQIPHRFQHVDVVVIGGGESGLAEAERLTAEGRSVMVIEAGDGDEALGLYPGPEVTARYRGEIVRFRASEVVVATGASEIQPVVAGSRLPGVLTSRAAAALAAAEVDLGRLVAVGTAPPGVDCVTVTGDLVRFEGSDRVEAVVVATGSGEERHPCDTVTVDLGTYPRDLLARMGAGQSVRTVGEAAGAPTLPPCPDAGLVCPCSDVQVSDLDFVWERGFQELELVKRATLAGTGTCQGGVCSPYLRSFVRDRGGDLQPTFTARPLARQMTIAEAAAGFRLPPVHATALDSVHRSLDARMDRIGGWWRPWEYRSPEEEYWAVREGVSLGDVSTLGKMLVQGPDAEEFLERLYPCRVTTLKPGRSRYALVLAESGAVMDDGLICRLDDTSFALTFTSGGASHAEAWVRDWANSMAVDVRIMDRTHSLGAINVTGPLAGELLGQAGLDEPLSFMHHTRATIAGVACEVYRLSFTGEASYELHHPLRQSAPLWNELMRIGTHLGVKPHGLHTLQTLRLEKGHVIVGIDTEPDSTPRRLGMEWAAVMDKPDFVGKPALARTDRLPLDRQLVGWTMEGDSPVDGTPIYRDGHIAGYVTSAARSPVLGMAVMLGWVKLVGGSIPATVVIDGREASHTPLPFYDPEGARARG